MATVWCLQVSIDEDLRLVLHVSSLAEVDQDWT